MKKLSSISPSVVPQFEPCVNCAGNPGWLRKVKPPDVFMVRCPCWLAHQQRVADALKAAGKK